MSAKQPITRPKTPRLSPNKRAELVSKFEKGESLDNEDYYVIKDKSGRLNVRKKKAEKKPTAEVQTEQAPVEEQQQETKPKKEPKPKAL